MDTRDFTIYDSYEDAKAAGVPDEFLVTGTRPALEGLKQKFKFTKGSFKPVDDEGTDRDVHLQRS